MVVAQLYLGHSHTLLFICTSGTLYTNNTYSTGMAVQDVKLLETWDSWTFHRHNQKPAPALGSAVALVVPRLNSD